MPRQTIREEKATRRRSPSREAALAILPCAALLAAALSAAPAAGADESAARPSARQGHALVSDGGGRLYLLGGNDGARMIREAWILDVETRVWEPMSLPAEVLDLNQMDAVWAGGLLVIMGSVPETISSRPKPPKPGAPDPALLNTVSIYDPRDRVWRTSHPVPAPSCRLAYSISPLPDGRVLLFGGEESTGGGWVDKGDSWVFDPRGVRWQALAPASSPPARRLAAMGPIGGGRILLQGGSAGEERLDDSWEYDPGRNAWTRLEAGSGPEPFLLASGAGLADGRFVLQRQKAGDSYPGDLWIYDPARREWSPAFPSEDFETRASPLAAVGDEVWLFGGSTEEYLFLDTVGFRPVLR